MAVAARVAAEDERRHRRGPAPEWGESWYFDFARADASWGGFVRVGLYPNRGVAWYWAALVGLGRRLVLVRDHELELPGGRDLEVRGPGIWSAVHCETPLDHWSVGLEAFGVALDDPTDAYRGERGDVVGLGFDLEWEATAPAFGPVAPFEPCGRPAGAADGAAGGYGQACRVSGEVLVGDERLDFDGTGHRGHAWGIQDWWSPPGDPAPPPGPLPVGGAAPVGGAMPPGGPLPPPGGPLPPPGGRSLGAQAAGVMADGGTFVVRTGCGAAPGGQLPLRPGAPPEMIAHDDVTIAATLGPDGLPVSAAVEAGARLALAAGVVAGAPLLVQAADGRRSRLARALCLYRARDGRQGAGWAQWLTAE